MKEIIGSKKEIKVAKTLYAKNLSHKINTFQENTHTNKHKQIFLAMITTSGLKKNIWSEGLVNEAVELKDFFS